MGLLQHVILPIFAAMHAFSVYACMDLSRWAEMIELPPVDDSDRESSRQLHMMGVLRGFNAAFAVSCVLSILSAQCRGAVVIAEVVVWAIVTHDAWNVGLNYYPPALFCSLAVFGALVSSKEMGIYSKDENKGKKH